MNLQLNDNWIFHKEPDEIKKGLKPCPFCGSEIIALHLPQSFERCQMEYQRFWGIRCRECGASFGVWANSDDPDDPEWERARIELVDLWNRRMK